MTPQQKWNIAHPAHMRANARRWRKAHPEAIKKQNNERRDIKKDWHLHRYKINLQILRQMLRRQHYRCLGCLAAITEATVNVDHDHRTDKVRGLLCRGCNWALGHVRDNPMTLRRLMAYLDYDRSKIHIYLAGALKNPRIPEIGNHLRAEGFDVMDEWYTPGPEADTNWQAYEKQRGRTYKEALHGRAATNIFCFDRAYLDLADIVILVLPAGKSAMLELGYAKGGNKQTYILLDGSDPDRYDIMPQIADHVVQTEADLIEELKHYQEAP